MPRAGAPGATARRCLSFAPTSRRSRCSCPPAEASWSSATVLRGSRPAARSLREPLRRSGCSHGSAEGQRRQARSLGDAPALHRVEHGPEPWWLYHARLAAVEPRARDDEPCFEPSRGARSLLFGHRKQAFPHRDDSRKRRAAAGTLAGDCEPPTAATWQWPIASWEEEVHSLERACVGMVTTDGGRALGTGARGPNPRRFAGLRPGSSGRRPRSPSPARSTARHSIVLAEWVASANQEATRVLRVG